MFKNNKKKKGVEKKATSKHVSEKNNKSTFKEAEEEMSDATLKEGAVRYNASARFQILLVVCFGLFLIWLLYKPVIGFNTDDEYPAIVSLTPQQIINLGGSPTYVDVGMYVRDVPIFEIVNGRIIADVTVWFLFDPRLVSLKRLSEFIFDGAKIIYKSEPYTKIEKEELLAQYDMRIEFVLKLDYKSFPLDDHKINLALTNYFLSPSEVIFESSRVNFILNPEMKIPGWQPVEKAVKTGFLLDKLNPYEEEHKVFHPRVIFSFDFARIGFRSIMVIIMPLLLIFMIVLFTWTFNPFGRIASSIMPISVMSITAVIAHHFVIENISPKTGYLMISNYIFLLILAGCCFVFLINVLGRRITGLYKDIFAFSLYAILAIVLSTLIRPLF